MNPDPDADPDPGIFVSDLQDLSFFAYYFFEGTFTLFFEDKKS
jgi:hypothetical protein